MMAGIPTVFIGIDTTSSHAPFGFVALDADCRLRAISQGRLEDVLSFLAGQSGAVVAVNAPARPGPGSEGQESLFPLTPAPDAIGLRRAEQELQSRGVRVTARKPDVARCPPWMRRGFALYGYLEQLGYRPFPDGGEAGQYLETHSEGAYHAMLDQAPYEAKTLEGRLQRQMVLHQQGLAVTDPMDFLEEVTPHRLLHGLLPLQQIYRPSELNAWLCAYTAWLAFSRLERIVCLGDPADGQIFLPIPAADRR